jgi:hypothetical protein
MLDSGTVYRLSAGASARLHEQGVADPVIDYMQRTYLNAVRREQRLRDWGYRYLGADGYRYGGRPFGWPHTWWWGPDDE